LWNGEVCGKLLSVAFEHKWTFDAFLLFSSGDASMAAQMEIITTASMVVALAIILLLFSFFYNKQLYN